MDPRETACECLERGARWDAGSSTYVGMDKTAGRFADVEIFVCGTCGRTWLYYSWEVEAFSKSGRWYAGVVNPEVVDGLAPEDAPSVLEELPWRLIGGGYFGGKVTHRAGPHRIA